MQTRPLNRHTTPVSPRYPEKIIQFGGGNFLRAFADWVIDILNEQTDLNAGIVIVKPTPYGDYAELVAQDGLYHVRLTGVQDGVRRCGNTAASGRAQTTTRLITCINRVVNPYTDFADYRALAQQPDIRFIISNTTEVGIHFDANARFDDQPPANFPAQLTQLLHGRYRHFHGDLTRGCIILPLELIEQNGDRLREIVLAYADLWQLDAAFPTWLTQANAWCNTLVDRIVPGFPHAEAETIWQTIGYEDRLLVEGEQYLQWIIAAPDWVEAEFPAAQTGLNIHFVSDVTPYRDLKVRVLNGAHTAVTPIAYLSGLATVREAITDENIGRFLTDLLWQEVLPTLNFPPAEREQYAQATLDRFRNPYLHHRLLDIALNSIAKFRVRLLPSLLAYQAQYGRPPERITFALAALIHFYRGEYHGEPIPLRDETAVIGWLQQIWQANPPWPEMAQLILQNEGVWGQDLTAVPALSARLSYHLEQIETNGLKNALPQQVKIHRFHR